jgi:hypothetical protein
MGLAPLELADIVRTAGADYRERQRGHLSTAQLRALWAIEHCRTPTLGGQLYVCDDCGHVQPRYHSCRNRHCPKCQGLASQRWIEARRAELLPVGYFHLVFTLPEELNPWLLWNPRRLYDLLFGCAWDALSALTTDPTHLGARIGCLALLHTWSQTLAFHPHLHCIVPAGGLAFEHEVWIPARRHFLAPVKALSRSFRGRFLSRFKRAYHRGELQLPRSHPELDQPNRFQSFVDELFRKHWVVYCKAPFARPQRVLAYLARYTHRVAITNSRLLHTDTKRVTFSYKDYRHRARTSTLTLATGEFLRRFLLHVLPPGFVRIRSYGLLANRARHHHLDQCRRLIRPRRSRRCSSRRPLPLLPLVCAACRSEHLHRLTSFARTPSPRGPPQ